MFAVDPFFAGFGNHDTDAMVYDSVKIPRSHIFEINPKGEIHLNGRIISYNTMAEDADNMFPKLLSANSKRSYASKKRMEQKNSSACVLV